MSKIETRKIIIPREVYEKMMYIGGKAAPNEVQFLASVRETGGPKELIFTIGDVYLIDQTVSGGSTEFDEVALANFVASAEHPEDIWCWIHSHVNMGVFWSSTDTATINRLLRSTKKLLSIVFTLDGKMKTRCDVSLKALGLSDEVKAEFGKLLPRHIVINDIDVDIRGGLSDEEKQLLDIELSQKLKTSRASFGYESLISSSSIPRSRGRFGTEKGKGITSVGHRCWTCSHSLMSTSARGEFEWECLLEGVDGINVDKDGDCPAYEATGLFKDEKFDEPSNGKSPCDSCANLMEGQCSYHKSVSGGFDKCLYYCPIGSHVITGFNTEEEDSGGVDKIEGNRIIDKEGDDDDD